LRITLGVTPKCTKRDKNGKNIAVFAYFLKDLAAHQEKFDSTLVRHGTPVEKHFPCVLSLSGLPFGLF
jgi:hypothetical protein